MTATSRWRSHSSRSAKQRRVKSRVTVRSIYGNCVVDTERLRFNGHDLCCVASVYEMREGQIQSLRFYMADKELTGSKRTVRPKWQLGWKAEASAMRRLPVPLPLRLSAGPLRI